MYLPRESQQSISEINLYARSDEAYKQVVSNQSRYPNQSERFPPVELFFFDLFKLSGDNGGLWNHLSAGYRGNSGWNIKKPRLGSFLRWSGECKYFHLPDSCFLLPFYFLLQGS